MTTHSRTVRHNLTMLRLWAVALLLASLAGAQDVARMRQVTDYYFNDYQFMGSVLVARDRTILFNKSVGSANLEWMIPNSPGTRFRIGSISKQFTAAAILLLEERGKLSISDLVSKHLPSAPPAWSDITLMHLLSHTSGIPDIETLPDYPSWEPFPSPVEKTVARFYPLPLQFQPGERYRYSSSGYIVLGYIIERLSGKSYEQFLKENIFDPLGMKNSGYDSNSAVLARRASGYGTYCPPAGCSTTIAESGDDPVVIRNPENAHFIHMSIPHAAGSLYSTTEDLLTWEQALFGGKLLSKQSLTKMITPGKGNYGLGLNIQKRGGRLVIGHSGGIEGFSAYLAYYPEDKTVIAVTANLGNAGTLYRQLSRLAYGEAVVLPNERKAVAMPARWQDFAGVYARPDDARGKYSIVNDGDRLMVVLPNKTRLRLLAASENRLFLEHRDVEFEFVRTEGRVTGLVVRTEGAEVSYTRE